MTSLLQLQANELNPTPFQLRAARAIMGLTQEGVAQQSGISAKTVIGVEARKCSRSALGSVVAAYRRMGVTFEASADYQRQTVSRLFDGPQEVPELPVD